MELRSEKWLYETSRSAHLGLNYFNIESSCLHQTILNHLTVLWMQRHMCSFVLAWISHPACSVPERSHLTTPEDRRPHAVQLIRSGQNFHVFIPHQKLFCAKKKEKKRADCRVWKIIHAFITSSFQQCFVSTKPLDEGKREWSLGVWCT